MKYLGKKRFSSPANSQTFVDNWDAVFSEGPEKEKGQDPVKDPSPEAVCEYCSLPLDEFGVCPNTTPQDEED